ncbi:hypothetical protein SAMN04487976_105216 [Xaviernesmea oryzae]|nr:hypothetical protein SAMN04487976_105216 [Xaviernesmea oryzae]
MRRFTETRHRAGAGSGVLGAADSIFYNAFMPRRATGSDAARV